MSSGECDDFVCVCVSSQMLVTVVVLINDKGSINKDAARLGHGVANINIVYRCQSFGV